MRCWICKHRTPTWCPLAVTAWQGAGIFDGDHLIVSRAITARPGHVVVACLNGDVLVKRLAQEQGQFILRSENPAYSPRYILENDELTIWGVVTHSLRNHLTHG